MSRVRCETELSAHFEKGSMRTRLHQCTFKIRLKCRFYLWQSQQDLNFLDEDEDEGIEKDQAERKRKRTQKSKTPDRPAEGDVPGAGGGGGNLAFKPEKSIWESPFLAADRGLDSAYPSSHASDQSRTSDESDDMSQKLAASLSVSIDEDVVGSGVDSQLNSPGNNNDTSVLLDSDNHKTIDLHNVRMMTVGDLTRQGSASSEESTSSRGSQGKRKKDNSLVAKLWNPRKRKDGDQGFAGDADSPSSQGATSADSGQVSPVYLEDLGESSSDFAPSTSTTQSSMTTFTFSSSAREECDETPQAMAVVTSQPTSQVRHLVRRNQSSVLEITTIPWSKEQCPFILAWSHN